MAWNIEYDSRVLKEVKKLDHKAQLQILDYFDERVAPSENPRNHGKGPKSSFSGLWRYRIGDYRAIYNIEDESLTVLVVRVGHPNKMYEKPL